MLKEKKRLIVLLCLLALLLIGLMGAKPLYYLYREISFGWSEHTQAELQVKAFAEEKGWYYAQYPQYIIDLLETSPEAEDFVLNYPDWSDDENDPRAYLEPLPRDTVPLFLQWDPVWGYETYGSSVIAVTGCGPTSLAMAGYYLTGDPAWNPVEVARFAQKNGYYERGYGSSWTLISEGAVELGLTATELPLVKKKLTDALEAGDPVILALGPGDFTTTGHYIVLTGLEEGRFRVNDPNSKVNSQRLWSYEELEGQIRNIWQLGKG